MSSENSNIQILNEERQHASISQEEISLFLYGSPQILQKHLRVQQMIGEDPILRFCPREYEVTKQELYCIYCKKMVRYCELFDIYDPDIILMAQLQFQEQLPLALHFCMFIPQIRTLGSQQQNEEWKDKIETLEWIGCYAQTELGHGSDIQSLETTATLDKNTQEFIINSPSIRAAKYWPGDLGKHATHTIVIAQLIVDGKSYGTSSFLVQIRDTKTHEAIQGMEVGDIGPKICWNIKDNGYVLFRNVRIPQHNMLGRYIQIVNGNVIRDQNDKVAYATMMSIRSLISRNVSNHLAQALTIAIRYSIYRTQFKNQLNQNENKLLDYQLQMNKLLPNLALAYALYFGGLNIHQLVQTNQSNIQLHSDFSLMQVVHCLLSGTKAFYSWSVHYAIEAVRQACGGQGFSQYSGIPCIVYQNYPNVTHEGENTIIALQCSRYIYKSIQDVLNGKSVHSSLHYLYDLPNIQQQKNLPKLKLETVQDFLDVNTIKTLMNLVALYSANKTYNNIEKSKLLGKNIKEILNTETGIDFIELAETYIHLYTFTSFLEAISTYQSNNNNNSFNIQVATTNLALLYANQILLTKSAQLFELGIFCSGHQSLLEQTRNLLLKLIRPNALVLVEAWNFSDNSLRSAIGATNGSYELLFQWSQNYNRSSKGQEEPGWTYLQSLRGKRQTPISKL